MIQSEVGHGRRWFQWFVAASLVVLVFAVHASAAEWLWTFDGQRTQSTDERAVTIDRNLMRAADVGDVFVLPVADADIQVVVTRRTAYVDRTVTLAGRALDHERGTVVITLHDDIVSGFIEAGDIGDFQLKTDRTGRTFVRRLDALADDDCEIIQDEPVAIMGAGGVAGQCDPPSEIDVLVVYPNSVADIVGGAEIVEADIITAVEQNNEAMSNSGIDVTLNLVYMRAIDVQPSDVQLFRLINPNDGVMDGVPRLRDAYAADLVVMIREGGGGVANGTGSFSDDEIESAYCIVGYNSLPNRTFAHEVGHLLGCCHVPGDGGGCGVGLLFDYSNGHRFVGASGGFYRTILAYSPGMRVTHYSSPNVSFDNAATGYAEADGRYESDCARTIREVQAFVAGFRCQDDICTSLNLTSDATDCDGNDVPDACEIARHPDRDADSNGVLDLCEEPCTADLNNNGVVDQQDLGIVLSTFGSLTHFDLNGDGYVNQVDLGLLLSHFGATCEDAGR